MKLFKKTVAVLTAAMLLINGFAGVLAEEQQKLDWTNPVDREILEQQQKEQEEAQQKAQEQEQKVKSTVSKIERKKYITALDEVANKNLSKTEVALERLKALNIADSQAELAADALCTRGQYFDMLARIMNGGEEFEKASTEFEFKDVAEGYKYYNSIAYLQSRHYVSGYEDGKLLPDEAIDYRDAVLLIVKTLGYELYAEYMGGVYDGYMNVATKLGLTKEVKHTEENYLTFESAVALIDKALETKTADLNHMTENGVVYKTSDDTLLYKNFELEYVSGVVTKNSRTALETKAGTGRNNTIEIGGKRISFSDTNISADSYLGLYCEVLYAPEDMKGKYIDFRRDRNDILVIEANDIYDYNSLSGKLSYDKDGRDEKETIDKDINIIFNGRAVEGKINDLMFTPDIGELAFIDNNNDGSYECLIIDSFAVYISTYTGSRVSDRLYDKNNVQPAIDVEDAESITIYRNDAPAQVTDIVLNDVMLVESDCYSFEEKGGIKYILVDAENSSYYRIVAVNDVLAEEVKSKDEENVELKEFKAIVSDQYEVARTLGKNVLTSSEIKSGLKGNFGLDAYGNIVYVNKQADGNIRYGYLVTAGTSSRKGAGNSIYAKIFSEDAEMLTAKLAQKVKVYNKWTDGELDASTYFPKTINNEKFMDIRGIMKNGKVNSQLIKFSLNSDDEVKEIYLSAMATKDYKNMMPPQSGENILECVADYTNGASCRYAASISMGFDFMFAYGTHTIGFQVPENTEGADDRDYKILKSSPYGNGATVNDALLYGVSNGGAVDVLVRKVKKSTAVTGVSMTATTIYRTLLIGKVEKVYDAGTDEVKISVSGYARELSGPTVTKAVTYSFSDSELQSQINATVTATGNVYRPETSGVKAEDLVPGDMIEINLDTNNNINGFKVLWKGIGDKNLAPQKGEWNWNQSWETINANGVGQLPFDLQNSATYGGEVVYCNGGTIYVDTGRDDGRYRRVSGGGYSPDTLYDARTGQNITVSTGDVRTGDYIYWSVRSQAIICFGVIRR